MSGDMSHDELRMVYDALSVRELKDMLAERGMPSDGAVEKRDLIDMLLGVGPPRAAHGGPTAQAAEMDATSQKGGGRDHEKVLSFCQVTNEDPGTAGQFLDMMGGDLEAAISMYMETRGAGAARGQASAGATSSPGRGVPGDVLDEEGVRAPLPTMRDTLLGGGGVGGGGARGPTMAMPMDPSIFPGGASIAALLNPAMRAATGGQPFGGMAGGGDDEKLEWMFSVPDGMSSPHPFQDTRNMCKQTQKWLLVNIQDHENFASHRLNRDVWRDETIQMLVQSGFIFWQRNRTSAEGQMFVTRYNVDLTLLPIIAIVDPRTGGKVREWAAGALKLSDVCNFLSDFLDQNQLDSLTAPKVRLSTESRRSSASGSPALARAPSSAAALDEDEEMARAIAMSMAESAPMPPPPSGVAAAPMRPPPPEVAVPPPHPEPPRAYVDVPPEPPEGTPASEVVKVQFRTADSKRMRRSFFRSDKVEVLYAFIEQQMPDLRRKVSAPSPGTGPSMSVHDYELLLAFPYKSLDGMRDMTIGEANLNAQTIDVRLVN